jgi:hypothetical protein
MCDKFATIVKQIIINFVLPSPNPLGLGLPSTEWIHSVITHYLTIMANLSQYS